MPTINLNALTALQNANKKSIKPTAKAKQNAPAKSLTQRATASVATTTTTTKPVVPKPVTTNTNNVTNATPETTPELLPDNEIVTFAKALEDLDKLITNDDPIRDATLEIIKRTQEAPHIANFLYENEDAFAIAIRAMRKLHSNRTEKRQEFRKKKAATQDKVNVFGGILGDLKL